MAGAPGVVLTAGAVARQLGVAVPTLRSWDRRYGLGPSEHDPGRHRRYTVEDVERLRRMLALMGEGVPPAAAARVVLESRSDPEPARDGGGTGALAVGRVDRAVRGLARAATRLDVAAIRERVEEHLVQRGALATWEELLMPLLGSIGESFERGADGIVEVEHAASAGILVALHGVRPAPEHGRLPALLACAPDEQHSLPLEALHAVLAGRDCASRFLGARAPADMLIRAADKLRPRSVVVWAHTARTARKVDVDALGELCPVLLLCGPGWSGVRAAREHLNPASMREVMNVILESGTPLPKLFPAVEKKGRAQ